MRLSYLLIAVAISWGICVSSVSSQNQTSEFIESSSPLPDGNRVISRSVPGGNIQTVVTAIPYQRNDSNLNSGTNNQLRESAFRQTSANSATIGSPDSRYPYPTTSVARSVLLHSPIRATATPANSIPYQVPTLGITNTVANRFSNCNCNSPSFRRVPAARTPVLRVQPAAGQIPTPIVQDSSQVSPFGSATIQSRSYLPAPDAQPVLQADGGASPLVAGSVPFRPVVRLVNVPPGTYTGQGIIGQPKAYVDGQPIRNLFRYILP